MPKKKQMSTNELAEIVKGGFKLLRSEMAKDEDLKKVKGTVNELYKMLDDEARFIQQMRTEYPILIKRLKRLETKLGLPHTILDSQAAT